MKKNTMLSMLLAFAAACLVGGVGCVGEPDESVEDDDAEISEETDAPAKHSLAQTPGHKNQGGQKGYEGQPGNQSSGGKP